ncbi:MAG: TonB-dependent receptor [Acidobacteria bacterium]|nr:TonB-dependent receptor [Acidobacteriota bacterium]
MRRQFLGTVLLFLLGCAPAIAQQTSGNITGRVLDQQGAAVPGATITAKNAATGFSRTEVSDAAGLYRLNALPVGIYEVTATLSGFATVTKRDVDVNVGQVQAIDFSLRVAAVAETINVTGASPLIETTNSSVGGIVDPKRIESLPLNGRQFANLAATIPGVGLAFHTDPTKSTQYSPQINGGNGRNVNYQIDGGDNNDDTVGGLLQMFPLEAIQEFNFLTQRFKAEYGRSNGGVLSVVTKSGTNTPSGSFFEFFRDKSMNALSETETLSVLGTTASPTKGDYRRNQFGGSFGGPIAKDTAHFFVAAERTQQDTTQIVDTAGLFPSKNGVFEVPYRENLVTAKMTANLNAAQYLSVRYGRNSNSAPYGAGPKSTFDNWGDSVNTLNSINLNHNWVLGGAKLNEFIFQYADFSNNIASRSSAPSESFPNGVSIGANGNTPQTTEQRKYQFRDDFSWHVTGHGGLGHDFKVGANFINEPHLFITFNTGKGAVFYTHLTNDLAGPISTVSISDGDAAANIPTKQFATYFQDDWRVSDRLTVNFGVRYDIVDGLSNIDESKNPNYLLIKNAAIAGKFNSLPAPVAALMNDFASDPQIDKNNIQPRVGAVLDVNGNGKDIIRGGWGVYTDFGYTNSNVLFAAADSSGSGFGNVFNVNQAAGIRNPNGTFFTVGQPLSNIQSQNQAVVVPGTYPLFGQWVDPKLQQPYQIQTNVGWSHELTSDTVLSIDFVDSMGRDLNTRPRVNQRIPGTTTRRISALLPTALNPNTTGNRPAASVGESTYDALIFAARRRLSKGVDFIASYTLARSKSTIGSAVDQLNAANIQDPNNPFDDPRQNGPTTDTDARHRVSLSAVFELPGGVKVAPIYMFRSALPVALVDGRDLNLDGDATEIPTKAYGVDTFDADKGVITFKELGACETVNCGRGMPQQQTNVRVSKVFNLGGRARVEAIGEIFNLFNDINPSGFRTRVVVPSSGAADTTLLQPTSYSGDFRRPEQRVGQIGLRFSF